MSIHSELTLPMLHSEIKDRKIANKPQELTKNKNPFADPTFFSERLTIVNVEPICKRVGMYPNKFQSSNQVSCINTDIESSVRNK